MKAGREVLTVTEAALALFVFIASLLVYLKTLAPSVFWWDSGELIANVSVLGIPHRPGFPLYILLVKVFTFLAASDFSWWVNLFSAVAASLSLGLTYLIFVRVSSNRYSSASHKFLSVVVGIGVVLVLGYNYSFWIQAVRAEVYSLALLFFAILFWLVVKAEISAVWPQKCLFLFFFLAGLSLANHPAIALSALPALLYLLMTKTDQAWKPLNLLHSILLFILGASVYLYLPLRAQNQPVLNWLNPADWTFYLSSIFAKNSLGHLGKFDWGMGLNLLKILKLFVQQMGIIPLLLAGFGLWSLGPKRRRWLWFVIILILFNWLALAALTDLFIPDNPDLHGYLLPSLMVLCLAFGWGSLYLLDRVYLFFSQSAFTPALKFAVTALAVIFVLLISAIPGYQSRAACDLSRNQLPETYARKAVADLASGSLVIIDNPNLDFLLRGLQYGEGFRSDLIFMDRSLLPAFWYCRQLRHNYPLLFETIPDTLTGERLALTLATTYLNRGGTVYWEFTERDSALSEFLLPEGYLCQFVKLPELFPEVWEKQSSWEHENLEWDKDPAFAVDGDAQRVWSRVMFNLGYFYECAGQPALAAEKYQKILSFSPEEDLVTVRLNQLKASPPRAENQVILPETSDSAIANP